MGPPNESRLWSALTIRRDPGTPEVAPRYDNGRTVRFAQSSSPGEIAAVAAPAWAEPRVLFMQHASDPVSFFDFDLTLEFMQEAEGARIRDLFFKVRQALQSSILSA